ncbi:MAG: hypothetical protein QM654_04435 [Dysgonamonadaceae bacterium]
MTTLKLKTQIIQEIDSDQDSAIWKEPQTYYRKLKGAQKSMPCQYTLDELKERLARGREETENGSDTEHEKFMKKVETWF